MNTRDNPFLPVSLLLRLEVAVPFVLFDIAVAAVVAVLLVVANICAERRYRLVAKFKPRLAVLMTSSFINGAILTLGILINTEFWYQADGEFLVDWLKVKTTPLYVLSLLASLIFLRAGLLLAETVLIASSTRGPDDDESDGTGAKRH